MLVEHEVLMVMALNYHLQYIMFVHVVLNVINHLGIDLILDPEPTNNF